MVKPTNTSKREQKKARNEQEQEANRLSEQAVRRRRTIMTAIPAVTVALSVGLYLVFRMPSAAGMTLLAGFLCWLAFALGAVGGEVPARDRGRAGSINFGRRR